jgi:hypothetical protein
MRFTEEEYNKLMEGRRAHKNTRPAKPVTKTIPKRMNKTEAAYQQYLEILRRGGEIIDHRYEPFNLRLADNTYYRPDFFVVYADHFEVHEVKGFWRDDARVKIKVAAAMFPWWIFKAIKKVKGSWVIEQF